jgi:hypothetical protein
LIGLNEVKPIAVLKGTEMGFAVAQPILRTGVNTAVIASEAKQSMSPCGETWIASSFAPRNDDQFLITPLISCATHKK